MTETKYNRPNRPYHIEAYKPEWVTRFSTFRSELAAIIGEDALRIEHMGSTSVPGLAAKPQIDILVEVENLSKITTHYDAMRQSGYTPKGDYTQTGEEYFTKDSQDGTRLASVHVYPKGHPEIAYQIKFREYLKSHPKEAASYARMKLEALAAHPDDYNAYGAAKRSYLEALRARINEWNGQTL